MRYGQSNCGQIVLKKKSDSSQTPSATARHTVRRPQHNRETANDLVSRLGNRRAQAVIASGMGPIDVNRLGNRRASALAKARASTGKPTPKLQPSKKSRALAQVHYNRRLQRKASVPSRQDSSEREARAAGEAMANQTSVQAPARIRQHQPTPNFSVRDALGSGQPLSAPLQSFFSAFLGQDFSSVRIHTGDAADEAARNLNAEAFAIGPDIAFRRGRFAPETHTGKVLLGHELTHVAQGADGGEAESRIQRQESPHVEQEQVCWPEQNASFVEPVQESELSAEHQVTVEVAPPPALEGMEEGQSISLELTIPSGPGESWREDVYIVPTQYVFASESDARAPWCEGPAEAEEVGQGPEEPNLGPGSMGPNSSAPSYSDSPHTIFASGDIVYALDGPIEVLSASADYVVTTTYTKFAVGAGSTTLVRTEAGYILVDAGMHQRGGRINAQLADAIVQRLADAVGD
ncbi:MAG: DUF4157 domain-containing protein, partial [Kofleriaceae bacterium]|nr:DUF4157 domain-containing protein [Kofleriaceae bacterium]